MNLVDFQIAVINDDPSIARNMLLELDRKTEAEQFQKAAQYFGFSLLDAEGVFYASRAELGPIFDMLDESGLRKICERHGILTRPLGWFGQNVRTRARQIFNLSEKDSKHVFVDYQGFLTIGAKGTTEQARQVFAYLLQMERAGRIALGANKIVKTNPVDDQYDRKGKVISMMSKVDRMQNGYWKRKAAEQVDELLEGALELGKQGSLFLPEKPGEVK